MGIALAIAAIVAIILLLRRAASGSAGGSTSESAETLSPESDLLRLCHGNKSQMERLIELERKKSTDISRLIAIARAAHILRRDKR